MKKEASPFIVIGAIVALVTVVGLLFYRQMIYSPPTPRVELYSSGAGESRAAPPPESAPKNP